MESYLDKTEAYESQKHLNILSKKYSLSEEDKQTYLEILKQEMISVMVLTQISLTPENLNTIIPKRDTHFIQYYKYLICVEAQIKITPPRYASI